MDCGQIKLTNVFKSERMWTYNTHSYGNFWGQPTNSHEIVGIDWMQVKMFFMYVQTCCNNISIGTCRILIWWKVYRICRKKSQTAILNKWSVLVTDHRYQTSMRRSSVATPIIQEDNAILICFLCFQFQVAKTERITRIFIEVQWKACDD